MSDLEITVVPRNLYYHEVAYVRGLEAKLAKAREALQWYADNFVVNGSRAAAVLEALRRQ
jgi:hypothetical protein